MQRDPSMGDESWEDIEALFAEAADLQPAARAPLLDARCQGRPDVRKEVDSLLAAHDKAAGFLRAPARTDSDSAPAQSPGFAGQTIGRFRLLEKIGEGGMGVVHRAERMERDFVDQVAIKLIAAPILGADALRRFRVERQILATLNHSDIVTLLDGGFTEGGQAYLAMKFVDGVPITEFCASRRLGINDRIRLFQRVCGAVQYAHQNGVIHRDLKPANILVTPDGIPKILDFGVAKLVDPTGNIPDATGTSLIRPMTPNYASPEQLRGLSVTTACDVYAIGVLLYELLTGTRPYETGGKSLQEVLRLVLETDPIRPRRATPSMDANLPYRTRDLGGDLDAIVLHALRKEADERYRSAAGLSDDLGRYLAGRPVEAREPSLGYVMRKLAARHNAAFATAAASLIVIVGLLGVSLWQGRLVRAERDRARAETSKARETVSFLSGLFQGANPAQSGGQTLTARDLLDRGTASIAIELKGQPDIQAALLLVMAEAYQRIGVLPKALELAQESATLRESSVPGLSVELAESLHFVGRMRRLLGRPAEAIPPLERALSLREALLGPEDRSVALTLRELALARNGVGRSEGSREMLERAIRIEERAAPTSASLALLYNNLGTTLHQSGNLEGARLAYERSIAVYGASEDGGRSFVSIPLVNIGTLMRSREDLAAAERFFMRALTVNEKWIGRETSDIAYVLGCLGDLARAKGDYRRAHEVLEESLRIYGKTRPPDHIDLAQPMLYLGETVLAEGRPSEALSLFARALRIREQTHGPDHAAVAEALVDLAKAHIQKKQATEGEPLLRRALAIQRRALRSDHPSLVQTLTMLGQALVARHQVAEARVHLEEAVRIARARLPETHSERRQAESNLGVLPEP